MARARWLFACLLGACSSDNDPGLDVLLRVTDAHYVAHALPPAGAGPVIAALRVPHAELLPGRRREIVRGSLAPGSEAVLIGLADDRGHWLVSAGPAGIDEPDLPTFSAELTFASATPPGPLTLLLAAVDGAGKVGPYQSVALQALDFVRSPLLSVELHWDNEADLDLRVTLPDGSELSPDNLSAYDRPALVPADPSAAAAATLDLDANANCQVVGQRRERASWSAPPQPGRYVAKVATASLCGESAAHWTLEVWFGGALLQAVHGTSLSADTRAARGGGTRALTFVLP